MKKYLISLGILVVILTLFLTNPDEAAHAEAVKEILKKEFNKKMLGEIQKEKNGYKAFGAGLGLMLGETFINKIVDAYVESDNYYVFSLTKIKADTKEKVIGFGILGNVYISEKLKENLNGILEKE